MSASRTLVQLASWAALVGLGMTAITALVVWVVGADDQVRRFLGLRFTGGAREPGAALEIVATNLRLGGACLVAAWTVGRRPQLRLALDATLALVAALNAVTVGAALGAYRIQLLHAVALHGPFELAAFALVGGAYLRARRGQLTTRLLGGIAAGALSLLVAAALLETYVQVGVDA